MRRIKELQFGWGDASLPVPVARNHMIRPASYRIAILLGSLQFGCGTPGQADTNDDFKQAAKWCYDQAYRDQKAKAPNWFTRYLDCRRVRVMPIEIYAYRKEADIRAIYEEMYKVAPLVDKGAMAVDSAYERWDQMKAERLGTSCGLKIEQRDGGGECVMQQTIKKR